MSDDTRPSPVFSAGSVVPVGLAFGVAMCVGAVGGLAIMLRVQTEELFDAMRSVSAALVVLAAIPTRVHVGPEALRVRWLFRSRMIRYADVKRAAPLGSDVVLVLADDTALRLNPPLFGGGPGPGILLERIWQTVSAGAEAGARPHERALLARSRRDLAAWVGALREIAPHGAQYRRSIDLERLWELVENPAVETEVRAAAAVALSPSFDDAARERLRAIARVTVDDRLRATLAAVADAEEPRDLAAALRSV